MAPLQTGPRYMKRIAVLLLALSFLLGWPSIVTILWRLWGTYILVWTWNDATFFIVQLCLCSIVVSCYAVLLSPGISGETEDLDYTEHLVDYGNTSPENLREFTTQFRNLVSFDHLLTVCFQKGLLVYNEIEKIRNKSNIDMQVMCLVNIIQRKGWRGITKLVACLEAETEHMGHAEIAQNLREAFSTYFRVGRSISNSSTSSSPSFDIYDGEDTNDEILRLQKELSTSREKVQKLETEKEKLQREVESLQRENQRHIQHFQHEENRSDLMIPVELQETANPLSQSSTS